MDKLKDKVKKRIIRWIILSFLMIFILPFCMVSCAVLIIVGILGGNDIEIANSTTLTAEYLIAVKTISDQQGLDFIKLLTLSTVEGEGTYNTEVLEKALGRMGEPIKIRSYEETLYSTYKKIYGELKTGAIPLKTLIVKSIDIDESGIKLYKNISEIEWNYSHSNDFGNDRTYGGERKHLGNDIMAVKGTPIVSMCDGIITQIGWNELGGWRIGITDKNGTYWYYAHMNSYAAGMRQGLNVSAGTLIGYVGSSGYGSVGTTGKFADHLHLQIGIIEQGHKGYVWVNPYEIVRFMEPYRTSIIKYIGE